MLDQGKSRPIAESLFLPDNPTPGALHPGVKILGHVHFSFRIKGLGTQVCNIHKDSIGRDNLVFKGLYVERFRYLPLNCGGALFLYPAFLNDPVVGISKRLGEDIYRICHELPTNL